MLFPTHAVPVRRARCRAAPSRLELDTADGDTLHGVHIPPRSAAAKQRTLILGFGGNAWNGADVATYLHGLYPEADVVAFHYRGYRPSTGSPSAEALLADAPLVHDFAVERVKPDRTVAVGFSIGSGVAASLAGDRPLDGADPGHAVRFAQGGGAPTFIPGCRSGLFFEHEMDAGRRSRGRAACRSRSSPASATR